MAVVRELVTLLDFKLEGGGLEQANAGVLKLKASIMSLGKLFGIYLAADKIYEVVDGLIGAGKEINKIQYQLGRMARAGDDIKVAQSDLFGIAQSVGEEYTHVLDVYKEFLNESKDSNVSQDQLLYTVENIYKGLRLSAASSEEMGQVFDTLNRAFRMGRLGVRQFGLIVDQAPAVVDALGKSLGKTREQMQEMAKDGKITADVLINGLGKSLPELTKEFANRPRKLGEALTYAWNQAAQLSARIWKIASVSGTVAKLIVRATDWVSTNLEKLSDRLGGLEETLKTIGWVVLIAVVPALLKMFAVAIYNTGVWLVKNALIIAQYAAIALAIAGIFLLFDDIKGWMQGKKSIMGEWLGPFDKFAAEMKKVFDESALLAPFKAFQLFLEGDFVGAWNKVKQAVSDTWIQVGLVILAIGVAWLGFKAWNWLSFLGLIDGIKGIVTVIGLVTTGAAEAIKQLTKMATIKSLLQFGVVGAAAIAALYGKEALTAGVDWINEKLGRDPKTQQADRAKADELGRQQVGEGLGAVWRFFKGWVPGTPPQPGATPTPAPGTPPSPGILDFFKNLVPHLVPQPAVTPGQVAPNTVAPGATQNNNTTVNQTNNVSVTAPPGSDVNSLNSWATGVMDKWGRQIRNAAPVTEGPKQ